MHINPYLFFEGRCEEAVTFYCERLDAKVGMMMRFKENPDAKAGGSEAASGCGLPPGSEEKIMHAAFSIGQSVLMASDGLCSGKPDFKGTSLSLTVDNEEQAEKYFNALSEGGQVHMALTQTFFAKRFGMVVDKFGVSWMVGVENKPA